MKKMKPNNSKFERMAEEATLDCYGEYEQFCGWACTLEEKLPLPLSCVVLGEEATLTKIEQDENGTSILGVIKKGKHKIRVPAQDIELTNKKVEHAQWLAYSITLSY